MTEDIRLIAYMKGHERYVFLYRTSELGLGQLLRTLGRFACNPELSFSWYDAAVVSQRVRQGVGKQ